VCVGLVTTFGCWPRFDWGGKVAVLEKEGWKRVWRSERGMRGLGPLYIVDQR
jgi:hypothetical protein